MATTTDLLPLDLQGKGLASPLDFEQMYRFAQVFQASGMFTDITDAAQAFVKICKGAELGLPPTAAMTAFDIIQKRLFVKPWAIAAKINACGYGSFQVETQTPEQCTIIFRRKYAGQGWVTLPTVSYTITEAQGHGLVQRSPHWKTSPAHMLYQRCMGRGGAMYFPELLAGIAPPPEDVEPDPEALRRNVRALYGEPLDPTAPSGRVPVPVTLTPDELLARFGPHADPPAPLQPWVPPGAGEPAGEGGLPYVAQIEAAILAHHGDVETWYIWAERRCGKPRAQFTVPDYQLILEAVRGAAALRQTREAQEGAPQPAGATQAPGVVSVPMETGKTPDAPGEHQEGPLAGQTRDLWLEEEQQAMDKETGNG